MKFEVGDLAYKINPLLGTTWVNLCHKRGLDPHAGYKVLKVEPNFSGNGVSLDPQNPVLLTLEGFNRRYSENRFYQASRSLEDML